MFARGLILFILLGLARNASAQGYIWTWYPGLYQFHASFELTDAEMQPGVRWQSQLFLNSISITDPNGVQQHWSTDAVDGFNDQATGMFYGTNGFTLGISLFDNTSQTSIDAGPSSITERSLPNFQITDTENGYWTYAPIPEPAAAALLAIGGAVACFVKRRKPC